MIAVLNLVRLVQAVRLWEFLASLPGVSPVYLAVTGLLWGYLCLAAAFGLWFGRPGTPRFTRVSLLAFILYYWVDLLFIAQARPGTLDGKSLPFKAALTVVFLLFLAFTFSRPSTQSFFRSPA